MTFPPSPSAPQLGTPAGPDIDWTKQRWLDRELQRQRLAQVRRWIEPGSKVLDIGCGDGALFQKVAPVIQSGLGIDPRLRGEFAGPNWVIRPGLFPGDVPRHSVYDVITLLAVLEHLPAEVQCDLGASCLDLLRVGGRVVITVPSPRVDAILDVLIRLGLVGGQAEDEHWGFDPGGTAALFPAPAYRQVAARSFQFGLNNIFVFERC